MSAETSLQLNNLTWNDEAFARVGTEIGLARDYLSAQLARDIRPESLIIGGNAVSEVIAGTDMDSCLHVGELPEASVKLEKWVACGSQVVRLFRGKSDSETARHSKLLARQVGEERDWLPGASRKRTAKIGSMALASKLLVVNIFASDEPMTDEWFSAMRSAARSDEMSQSGLQATVRIMDDEPKPFDKGNVLDILRVVSDVPLDRTLLEQLAEQKDPPHDARQPGQDTESSFPYREVISRGQQYIDAGFSRLDTRAGLLSRAVQIVRDGTVVHPSRPQHAL